MMGLFSLVYALPNVVACAVPVAGAVNLYQTVLPKACGPAGQDGIGSCALDVAAAVLIASVNGSDVAGVGEVGDGQLSLGAG